MGLVGPAQHTAAKSAAPRLLLDVAALVAPDFPFANSANTKACRENVQELNPAARPCAGHRQVVDPAISQNPTRHEWLVESLRTRGTNECVAA